MIVDDIEPKVGLKYPCGHIQRIAVGGRIRGIRHKGKRPVEVLWEGLEGVPASEKLLAWVHWELRPCLACVELEARAKAEAEALRMAPRPFFIEKEDLRRFIK